jgi:hypothetical protein
MNKIDARLLIELRKDTDYLKVHIVIAEGTRDGAEIARVALQEELDRLVALKGEILRRNREETTT